MKVGSVFTGGVAQLAAGTWHVCAAFNDGSVQCWGLGKNGQLGYGEKANILKPNGKNIFSEEGAVQLTAGAWHTCALLQYGGVRCWGLDSAGQLGYGANSSGDLLAPITKDVINDATQVSAGYEHVCVLLKSGSVKCWGAGGQGQIGWEEKTSAWAPVDTLIGAKVVQLSSIYQHNCAILENGALRCWGLGGYGQLGHNNTANIGDKTGKSIIEAGDVPVFAP